MPLPANLTLLTLTLSPFSTSLLSSESHAENPPPYLSPFTSSFSLFPFFPFSSPLSFSLSFPFILFFSPLLFRKTKIEEIYARVFQERSWVLLPTFAAVLSRFVHGFSHGGANNDGVHKIQGGELTRRKDERSNRVGGGAWMNGGAML